MANNPPNIPPDFPHVAGLPHDPPFIGRLGTFYALLGDIQPLRPYHDRAHWVNTNEFANTVFRFYTEYHIDQYRLLLWANAMDMDLSHVYVGINPWTMDLEVRADILRPAIPPFDHMRPALLYRSLYPIPAGFFNLFRGEYMVRNSTIYIRLPTAAGVGDITINYQIPPFVPQNQQAQNQEAQNEELQIE